MSTVANWSYTAKATIWRKGAGGRDENGDPLNGYAAPVVILVDYEGGLSKRISSIGGVGPVCNGRHRSPLKALATAPSCLPCYVYSHSDIESAHQSQMNGK